ncbi:MAG: hypothetical protein GXP46_12935 [Deferribacteres bacterium]|nr:hypothetical protein [Deferribacteres bacterium]
MIIVSSAAPLINISRLKLFQRLPLLYKKIIIPEAVFEEVVVNGKRGAGASNILKAVKKGWMLQERVNSPLALSALSETFCNGEAEAIVLASEVSADAILLDDNKARRVAGSMKLSVTGTIGFLIDLKQMDIIPKIKPYLEAAVKLGFGITPELFNKILLKTGE